MFQRILLVFFCFILVSCSNDKKEEISYEETKAMVMDILHSGEGEKLISDLLSEKEFKQQLLMNSDFIKESIESALIGEEAKEQWKELFKDNQFVTTFSESLQEQTENIFKNLLNNPDFRSSMIELFRDPSMQEELLDLFKSTEFRSHIQDVITSSLEDPEMVDKLKKMTEETKEDKKK